MKGSKLGATAAGTVETRHGRKFRREVPHGEREEWREI